MDKEERIKPEKFEPAFLATGVGSLPHKDISEACQLIGRTLPHTPFWPQLPQHSLLEGMNLQVSPGLPFLRVEEAKGEVHFDRTRDPAKELERGYNAYLTGEIESFRLLPAYAGGFEGMVHYLEERKPIALKFFKGQMVGPVTYGLAVQDDRGKDIIHDEVLYDALIKGLMLRGRWIIQRMKKVCEKVILFIDEPGLSGYGSAFFSVDGATISRRLNEVIEDLQAAGSWVGIHCCGNTDWSLLLNTKADIINFDAWGFFDRVVLYAEAVEEFLSRGGVLAWGIVPTSEFTGKETVMGLVERLEAGFRDLVKKGISEKILHEQCLLTPS